MPCCSPACQKWTVFGLGAFFIVLGIVLVACWADIVASIKKQELNVGSSGTTEYKMWEETPIPMYIEFYLFNWTNYERVVKSSWAEKPEFVQMGPYVYAEKHIRKQVIFNDNHTVTYKTQRIWHYEPKRSNGSLDDQITCLNPILVTVGAMVKNKHAIVRMGVNFFIEEKRINLTVTKTAREFIMDGYEDPLLDLLKKLHLRHIDIPFTKFGWFAERNNSIDYDGVYNMYDGTDDVRKLGRFTAWNYNSSTKYYDGYCGEVNGTSGELWYPVQNDLKVQVFSPDTCSTLTVNYDGDVEMYGLEGRRYSGDASLFDNGTKFPEMGCFRKSDVLRSGLRNVSECKFGAPAFISYPHFYLADPYYREAIGGMKPNASEHRIYISIEPETGIPLQAHIAAQISLHLERIDRIKMLENVTEYFIPMMWFKQTATLSEALANQAKLILILPSVGVYTGYGVLGLGCLMIFVFGVIMFRNFWKGREEERLLNRDVL